MRERYLEAFDVVRIDCLNGDKYKTGKIAPDGSPDPSIFSTEGDPVGIQVGTAIATLVRKADHAPAGEVRFRNLWGPAKRPELLLSSEAEPDALYDVIEPVLPLGLPFVRTAVSEGWFGWPALPDLFPVRFPGVQTKRDAFLVDTDLERLRARVTDYFDASLSHDDIARRYPVAMKSSSGFAIRDAHAVRDALLARGDPNQAGFVRHSYRSFDNRWLYWEAEHGLLGRPVPDYRPHVFQGNAWLVAQQKPRRDWSPPQVISHIGCLDLMDRGATCIPVWLRDDGIGSDANNARRANLSNAVKRYLDHLGAGPEDLFHYVVATLHDLAYRTANAGALRMERPRIPRPGWPDGAANRAVGALAESAARGRELARLLDPDTPVAGATQGALRPEFGVIAVPATIDQGNMTGDDFALAAVDVYLNDRTFWRNVPAAVWSYKLGGYQVLKKWLSYRSRLILDRPLKPDEVQHFTDTTRRIGTFLAGTVR